MKHEREKNVLLNRKLLDHYLLTTSSDLQTLPNDLNNSTMQSQQGILSPIVPQQLHLSTPNDSSSRILLVHTPACSINLNQVITSPTHCSSLAMKQQVKLAGSNMFRHYSSII